ncbi:MAG: cysteine--tRNA ligase [Acidimicrobiales bacterium]
MIRPVEGTHARTWEAEPGRLAVDDLDRGLPGAGWIEAGPTSGRTALVRVSLPPSEGAAADVVDSLVAQTGAETILLDTDTAIDRPGVTSVPPLRVANSLGRQVSRLVPRIAGQVRMYACGPTVYSYQHVGNMRTYVFGDTVKRALLWRGYDVRHVINITDVGHLLADADQGEDKVEEASRREGKSVEEITGHYTSVFWDDIAALNVLPPDEWPRASAYVPDMINFATVIQDHGFAYAVPEGLYFDTALQRDYGALAGLDLAAQRATDRIETVEGKRAPSDFALWRTFTDERERLMQWDSPWGTGAPGWHLECSVMSMSLLGEHFDLHLGGIDHRELHHVNEIAQSEAFLQDGEPWVPYWMHGEFLTMKDRKMAKSAGATVRLADVVAHGVHPLAFRYLLLQSHYASQLEFSELSASAAHIALKRLAQRVRDALGAVAVDPGLITLVEAYDQAGSDLARARLLELDAAVAEDLTTPSLVALVQTWARSPAALTPADWAVVIRAVNALTGLSLGLLDASAFAPALPSSVDVAWVEERIAVRDAARAAKEWAVADQVRDELAAAGLRVEDTPEGTHWYVAPA